MVQPIDKSEDVVREPDSVIIAIQNEAVVVQAYGLIGPEWG